MEREIGPCVFDSSVWVGLFLDADTNHEKAATLFDSISRVLYVPYIVIAEVATTLAYKHSKQQADRFLQFISEDERCTLVDNRHSNDVAAFMKISEKISFADIAIIEVAFSYEAALVTFDKQMKKIYERRAAKK